MTKIRLLYYIICDQSPSDPIILNPDPIILYFISAHQIRLYYIISYNLIITHQSQMYYILSEFVGSDYIISYVFGTHQIRLDYMLPELIRCDSIILYAIRAHQIRLYILYFISAHRLRWYYILSELIGFITCRHLNAHISASRAAPELIPKLIITECSALSFYDIGNIFVLVSI